MKMHLFVVKVRQMSDVFCMRFRNMIKNRITSHRCLYLLRIIS